MPNTAFDYVLRLADSPLILGQRLSEWCGHGPILEEDLALTNVALDLIGQARLLLAHAGALEGAGPRRGSAGFPAHGVRLSQLHVGGAPQRRLRRDGDAQSAVQRLPAALVGSAAAVQRPRARGDRGQERQGDPLSPAPRGRLDRAPRRRYRGVARASAIRARPPVAVYRWSSSRPMPWTKRRRPTATASPPHPSNHAGRLRSGRSWRKPRCTSRNERRSFPRASAACTASTWGTC